MVLPRGFLVRKGETQNVKIKMNLEVHNLDNKATILYVMKYVSFRRKHGKNYQQAASQAQAKIISSQRSCQKVVVL